MSSLIWILIICAVIIIWKDRAKNERRRKEARRLQEWREQTIANGILRAEAAKGELLARAMAQQEQQAVIEPRNAERAETQPQPSSGEDFIRLLNKRD
jgi:hypothetical protein